MVLKSTDITDLVVSSYGNYYWKAKINGLAREGSLDTKSILVTKSKLRRFEGRPIVNLGKNMGFIYVHGLK